MKDGKNRYEAGWRQLSNELKESRDLLCQMRGHVYVAFKTDDDIKLRVPERDCEITMSHRGLQRSKGNCRWHTKMKE